MKFGTGIFTAALLGLLAQSVDAPAQRHGVRSQRIPTRVGACARTTIRQVTQRLEDGVTHRVIPGSGSVVVFANGLYQVSYEQVRAVNRSRRGDPVITCLVELPQDCPPGDDRGKVYRTTNLRTHQSWTLPDSQHSCGGA